MKKIYNPYEKFGVRRAINAWGAVTRIGGSISSPEVFRAMEDASKSFVNIPELQRWAGEIIAETTGADAGLPTAGASNALMLAAAACIMKGTELDDYNPLEQETWTSIIQKLPMHTRGLKTEFIIQKRNRHSYDHLVECAGGRLIEAGTDKGTTEKELDKAFNPVKTAAYYFIVNSSYGCLPLSSVVRIAHKHGVPVIVDAAGELPPKKNLKRYIQKSADLVIFSGGKAICGPNNSGMLTGRKDLVKLAHLQAYPFHGIGRASKMSRETIVGLITALKIYLTLDEEAIFKELESKLEWMAEQLNMIPNVEARVNYKTTIEEKDPMWPLCCVNINNVTLGMNEKELLKMLRGGNPSIEAMIRNGRLEIDSQFLLEGDEYLIIRRIKEILHTRG